MYWSSGSTVGAGGLGGFTPFAFAHSRAISSSMSLKIHRFFAPKLVLFDTEGDTEADSENEQREDDDPGEVGRSEGGKKEHQRFTLFRFTKVARINSCPYDR